MIQIPPFRTASADWDIDWREQSGGTTISGRGKVVIGDKPRWVGTLNKHLSGAEIGRWRAARWAGQGLTGVYRVRMIDTAAFSISPGMVGFTDDTYFDDGAGFYSVPTVIAAADAAMGATEIIVDESAAPAPIAEGQIMSHGDYPFGVVSRFGTGASVALSVQMPLRVAIQAGDLIDMVGTGLFETVEAGAGRVAYGPELYARPSLQLREWLR